MTGPGRALARPRDVADRARALGVPVDGAVLNEDGSIELETRPTHEERAREPVPVIRPTRREREHYASTQHDMGEW